MCQVISIFMRLDGNVTISYVTINYVTISYVTISIFS